MIMDFPFLCRIMESEISLTCFGLRGIKMEKNLYTSSFNGDTQLLLYVMQSSPLFHLQRTPEGDTALHIAARYGHLNCIQVLIAVFALYFSKHYFVSLVFSFKNSEGNTPLHEAAREGHAVVVKALIHFDSTMVRASNKNGETPLHLACENDNFAVVEEILYGSGYKAFASKTTDGKTCFHYAAFHGHLGILKMLSECEKGMKALDVTDSSGATPLHSAAEGGHAEVVQYLISVKSTLCYKYDKFGRFPVHVSARKGDVKTIEVMASECPDCINMKSRDGKNILHHAVENNQSALVDWIGNQQHYHKFRGDEADKQGNHALHLAAMNSDSHLICAKLLEAFPKVKVNARNKEGMSVVDVVYATRNNKTRKELAEMNRLLRDAGSTTTYEEMEKRNGGDRDEQNNRIMEINAVIAALIVGVTATGPMQVFFTGSLSQAGQRLIPPLPVMAEAAFMYMTYNIIGFFSAISVLSVWILLEPVSGKGGGGRPWARASMSILAVSVGSVSVAFYYTTSVSSIFMIFDKKQVALVIEQFALSTAMPIVVFVWIFVSMWISYLRESHDRKPPLKRFLRRAFFRLFVRLDVAVLLVFIVPVLVLMLVNRSKNLY